VPKLLERLAGQLLEYLDRSGLTPAASVSITTPAMLDRNSRVEGLLFIYLFIYLLFARNNQCDNHM